MQTQSIEMVTNTQPLVPEQHNSTEYKTQKENSVVTSNITGKKIYSKEFMIQIGKKAYCQKKPDVLSNWSIITNIVNTTQFRTSGVREDFLLVLLSFKTCIFMFFNFRGRYLMNRRVARIYLRVVF